MPEMLPRRRPIASIFEHVPYADEDLQIRLDDFEIGGIREKGGLGVRVHSDNLKRRGIDVSKCIVDMGQSIEGEVPRCDFVAGQIGGPKMMSVMLIQIPMKTTRLRVIRFGGSPAFIISNDTVLQDSGAGTAARWLWMLDTVALALGYCDERSADDKQEARS
jgi:hypothetical protein